MKDLLLVVALLAVFALSCYYIVGPIVVLFTYLPMAGYAQMRRLGYSVPKAATLALGVAVLAVFATIIIAVIVPTPDGFWGVFEMVVLCAAMPILLSAFGCTVLVRKLPKRECRVSGHRRVRFPFTHLGYLVIAGAIAGGVAVPIFAPAENRTLDNIIGLLVLVLMVSLLGMALMLIGKRVARQVSIEEAVRLDPRSPVLFLRPFVAERVPFVQGPNSRYGQYAADTDQLVATVRSMSDSEGNKQDEDPTISIMFEVYLGTALRERIGPLIALGNPEDYLPPEGAIRTYAEDEGWYEYFERLARQAVCMIMPVSNSNNLQRELAFLRREGLQQRLFIFTPLWSPGDERSPSFVRPLVRMVSRLYGLSDLPATVASWSQLAENLAKLGFDLGDDPGRGAVVTFDSKGNAIVVVTAAETPPEFVEPLREYLTRTFALDLGEVAAAESKAETPVESEENYTLKPARNSLIASAGHSDECNDPTTPTATPASVPAPPHEGRLIRFLNSKRRTWIGVALLFISAIAYVGFHVWQLNKAQSLYDQKRYVEAAHYFQKEADSGSTRSMTNLGYMYENGLGVSKSDEKAAGAVSESSQRRR